jgi:hypothetical protein
MFTAAACDAAVRNVLDADFEEREPENTELDDSNEVFAELVLEAKSTRKGYSIGTAAFDAFAKLQGIKPLSELTEDDLQVDPENKVMKAFGSFATYLMSKTKKDGTHFRPFSQVQYLSNVKNVLAKKFPRAVLLKVDHVESQWYNTLLYGLKLRGRAAAIKRGENVRDRTLGIRRKLLIRLCDRLLVVGTVKAMEQRAILLTLYHSVGRASEASFLNMHNMQWSEDDELLWTGWNEHKTGRNTEISYHEDYDCYEVCQIHGLACYIITAGGKLRGSANTEEPDWLFPDFANLADGGASTKATAILKALVGVVPGLTAKHTAHGLRAGPTDDMAMNRHCDVVSMIARGNWDWVGECQLFGYIYNPLHVSRAGKSLANWPDPYAEVFVHRLFDANGMDDADRKALEDLAHDLFLFSPEALQPDGRLVNLRNLMLASLLTNFEGMRKKFGVANAVVAAICDKAVQNGITMAMLDCWGEKIRLDFKLRNANNPDPTSSNGRAFVALTESFESLKAENLVLKGEIKAVSDCCARMESCMEIMMARMAAQTSDASASPTKKRGVSVSTPPVHPPVSSVSPVHPPVSASVSTFFNPNPAKKQKVALVSHDTSVPFPRAITGMNLAELLGRVILEGIQYEQENAFGKHVIRQAKGKVVQAIRYVKERATDAEREVLNLKPVNRRADGYKQHTKTVMATVYEVVARAFLSLEPYTPSDGIKASLNKNVTAANLTGGQVAQYIAELKAATKAQHALEQLALEHLPIA